MSDSVVVSPLLFFILIKKSFSSIYISSSNPLQQTRALKLRFLVFVAHFTVYTHQLQWRE
jgi:hypothetical protein